MTQEQALNTLVQGVLVAQKNGAYTLDEAAIIKQAVDAFKPAENTTVEAEQVEQIEE